MIASCVLCLCLKYIESQAKQEEGILSPRKFHTYRDDVSDDIIMTDGGKISCFDCMVGNDRGSLGPDQQSLPAHRSLPQPSNLAQDTTGLHQSDNIDAQSISITAFDEVDHHSNTDKLHHRYHLLQEQHLLERYERFIK